jgi:hypothetical protein
MCCTIKDESRSTDHLPQCKLVAFAAPLVGIIRVDLKG